MPSLKRVKEPALGGNACAILTGALDCAREHSKRSACASNLHRLGQAFSAYATDNKGYAPRNPAVGFSRHPVWMIVLTKYFRKDPLNTWADVGKTPAYQCPSHPTEKLPSAYVINCFSFETADKPVPWWGSPATQIAKFKNTSTLPWLLETPDFFPGQWTGSVLDAIYQESAHGVHHPDHLEAGREARVSMTRHAGNTANVSYADGHVELKHPGELKLEDFDDGIRSRDWTR